LRGDKERGGFLGVSTSQWISIILVVGLTTIILISYFKKKKALKTTPTPIEEKDGATK
jgi:hypothetical protein